MFNISGNNYNSFIYNKKKNIVLALKKLYYNSSPLKKLSL